MFGIRLDLPPNTPDEVVNLRHRAAVIGRSPPDGAEQFARADSATQLDRFRQRRHSQRNRRLLPCPIDWAGVEASRRTAGESRGPPVKLPARRADAGDQH